MSYVELALKALGKPKDTWSCPQCGGKVFLLVATDKMICCHCRTCVRHELNEITK